MEASGKCSGVICPAQGDAGAAGLDAMDGAADAERQGFGQDALLAPRQRLLERIGALGPGTMGVLGVSRRTANFWFHAAMKAGVKACASSIEDIPLSRISRTSRSCKV